MPHVLSLQPVSIRTLSGYSVQVQPKTPTMIPARILGEALAAGCVQCDEQGNVLINGIPFKLQQADAASSQEAAPASPPAAGSREQAIQRVVVGILDDNDQAALNALTGLPKVPVVSERCGFKVSVDEIRAAVESLPA